MRYVFFYLFKYLYGFKLDRNILITLILLRKVYLPTHYMTIYTYIYYNKCTIFYNVTLRHKSQYVVYINENEFDYYLWYKKYKYLLLSNYRDYTYIKFEIQLENSRFSYFDLNSIHCQNRI